MSKKCYNLDNAADVEELNHLVFEEIDESRTTPIENFDESDESETEDHVETRDTNSDTDHEIDDQDENEGDENQEATYYIVRAQSSTPIPDDPYDYYDDREDNRVEDNRIEDQNVQQSSLPPIFITKPQKVVVEDSQNATLHCQTKNAENYVLVWRRGDEIITQGGVALVPDLYSLLPDQSLVIKNVKPSLTGQYSCEILVTPNIKPSLTHRVKIENDAEVISLKAEGNKTQLYFGDTLTLTCNVIGNPVPTIKWYLDGNEASGGAIELQSNKVQASSTSDTLVIENVNYKNNGTYRCTAANERSFDQQSIVIEVFGETIYLDIKKLYDNKRLIGLECTVKRSKSKIYYFSWQSDNNLKLANIKESDHSSIMLIFNDIHESNFGIYTCLAKSRDGAIEKSIYVQNPSKPFFERLLRSSRDLDKYNITLIWKISSFYPIISCLIFDVTENEYWPHSWPVTIHNDGLDSYYILYSQFLTFGGLYAFKITCQNAVGWSDESDIQDIQLTVEPIIIIEKIYSKRKKLSALNCMVQANPLATIIWKKDDEMLNSSYTVRKSKNSLGIEFSNDDDSNFGTYTCIAKNYEGTTRKSVVFQRPLRPIFRELMSSERDVIVWTVSSREPLQYCFVYYSCENEIHQYIADTQIKEHDGDYLVLHIPLLPYDGICRFKVKCLSESGWSDESEEKSLSIRDKGRDSAASHTDSRISRGLQLAPSLMVILSTFMIMNP